MSKRTIYTSSIFILLLFLLLVSSCGPVNRLTRVKKIPREYSLNYCGEDTKAPKTDLNKEPWIVYSDREKNQTYNNAGGKVKAKDVDYLDAFLVIGKKKKYEYLKLIKYTPDILKNGKLEYKKAEYYGWIHQSKLLLNQQSVTDIAGGKKNKMLVVFSDTTSINEPEKYFANDSIKTYKDLELKSQAGTVSPYSVVYQLKTSENGSLVLVSKKPYLKAEEVKSDILGWVDKSLISDIGTGLHTDLSGVPDSVKRYVIKTDEDLSLNEDITDASNMLSEQYPSIKYNPVTSYSTKDTLIAFRTKLPLPVFDYSNNYIFNVNGGSISYKGFKQIAKGLKNINISFVFEGGDEVISQFPQIVNALQNLQPLFEQNNDGYTYQFNSVMTFDETGKLLRPLSSDFTSDYSQVINLLSDKANQKDKLRPIKLVRGSWSALRKSVENFRSRRDATNLIVLIGDKRVTGAEADSTLMNRIEANNCRIIGFQVYADGGDEYNNFVLDIEDMINFYADRMVKTKRDILVSPEQIKRDNTYKQAGEHKNSYRLDFPENSITQGGIFFPQKSEYLPMEILTHNVDTIIGQIKDDNRSVTDYMLRAFRSVGNNRTKFDSLFVENYSLDTVRTPKKKFVANFVNETPGWHIPSKIVVMNDSTNRHVDYRLMLSEAEMKELKEFVASLSEQEVDYIYQQSKKEAQKRKPCNCPEDDLFIQLEKEGVKTGIVPADQPMTIEMLYANSRTSYLGAYANTDKIRNHLTKTLLKPIKYCKLCKENGGKLKSLTLAEAQFRITGSPTSNELLHSIRIKDLKNKKKVSDKQLEELILYYKKMKKELDKAEQFESNGESYYWVNRKLLP